MLLESQEVISFLSIPFIASITIAISLTFLGPRGEGDNYADMMKDHRTKGFSSLIIIVHSFF